MYPRNAPGKYCSRVVSANSTRTALCRLAYSPLHRKTYEQVVYYLVDLPAAVVVHSQNYLWDYLCTTQATRGLSSVCTNLVTEFQPFLAIKCTVAVDDNVRVCPWRSRSNPCNSRRRLLWNTIHCGFYILYPFVPSARLKIPNRMLGVVVPTLNNGTYRIPEH